MKQTMVRKLFAITLAGILALSLAACAGSSGGSGSSGTDSSQQEEAVSETPPEEPETPAEEPEEEPFEEEYPGEEEYYDAEAETASLLGGWEKADSPVITDEIKALVEKASAHLTGAEYTPVAYLGSQIVAGTNHLILCRTRSTVDPDGAETYMFVTIYEDLDGNAQITQVIDTDLPTNIADLSGGWFQAESPEVTDEIEELCGKAFEKLTGVGYKPVALLSTQVVAGMNYCILCRVTPVVPDPAPGYALVYIYADLDGNAGITNVAELDIPGLWNPSDED